jgi:uncharacterized RDD family membrane protein YckC
VEEALGAGTALGPLLDLVDEAVEGAASRGDRVALERLATLVSGAASVRSDPWPGLEVAAARARALAVRTGAVPATYEPAASQPSPQPTAGGSRPDAHPAQHYAGWWRRSAAFAVDCVLLGVGFGLLGEMLGDSGGDVLFLMNAALAFAYFVGLHAFGDGATAGKAVFRVAVRCTDDSPVELGRAAWRAVATTVLWVTVVAGLLDMVVGMANDRNRWLHDVMAGTVVVRR